MRQTNLKDLVEKLGLKAESITDEVVEKFVTYKDGLDKETRRKTRVVWGVIAAVCLVVGFVTGYAL